MTTEEAVKRLSASPAIGWQCDEWGRAAINALMQGVVVAQDLLDRAATAMEDRPITGDFDWWREYFVFIGQHMILTDEGWESGEFKQSYADQAAKDGCGIGELIQDEVNAPV